MRAGLKQVGWWVLACGVSGSWVVACGDNFAGSCQEALTCPTAGGAGGQEGDQGPGGVGAHDAGGKNGQTAGSAGASAGSAGGPGMDNTAGAGMASGGAGGEPGVIGASGAGGAGEVGPGEGGGGGTGEEPITVVCAETYVDWLKGGFGFPDGAVLGTLDSPSFPWRPAAGLTLASGRLTGTGTAVVTQGTTFSYSGMRLRARVRFTDAEQDVAFAVNTAADGAGGLRVTVSALGELVLSEGQANRGQASFDPLAAGQDYFVEVAVNGAEAVATLASGNYAKVGSIVATVATDTLLKSAKGARASVRLGSESGVSPNVDELSVARCGGAAPSYDALLVDNFERANSTTIGSPQTPANKSWTGSAASVRIVDGWLETKGLERATIPLTVPVDGLRIRTAIKMVGGGANPYLWADLNYNAPSNAHGSTLPGFWIWGPPNDYFHTGIFQADNVSKKYLTPLTPNVAYYAQLDRDDDVAVLTVRSQSFSGPILSAEFNSGLTDASPGANFTVADEGGDGTRFDDIRADGFAFK